MAYYSSPKKYEDATEKDLQLNAAAFMYLEASEAW